MNSRIITVECHLVLKPRIEKWAGENRVKNVSVETRAKRPSMGPHDQSLKLTLSVPESLFFKPALEATISVPEDQAPPVITPELQANIAQAIKDQMGITLHITAPEVDDE